jgi:hypothetical protein
VPGRAALEGLEQRRIRGREVLEQPTLVEHLGRRRSGRARLDLLGDLGEPFEDRYVGAVAAQLGGEEQADRPAADHDHVVRFLEQHKF